MSRRGPIDTWTPELDALLIEHFPTMAFGSLSMLLGRTVLAIKARAHKLRLRRDPATSHAARQAAGRAGYAAAKARRGGEPIRRNSAPPPPPKPAVPRELGPDALAFRKRRLRAAAEVLVEHGVDERAAELAVHVIVTGRVPGVRFEA